jgi:hypothetical protein
VPTYCDDRVCDHRAVFEVIRTYGPTPHFYACREHLGDVIIDYMWSSEGEVRLIVDQVRQTD